MGIEKYNERYLFQVEKLNRLLKTPIDDDESVTSYLYSLNGDGFINIATQMLSNSTDHPTPDNLVEATDKVLEWYTTTTAINKRFNLERKPAAESKVESALITQADTAATDKVSDNNKKQRGKNRGKQNPRKQNHGKRIAGNKIRTMDIIITLIRKTTITKNKRQRRIVITVKLRNIPTIIIILAIVVDLNAILKRCPEKKVTSL